MVDFHSHTYLCEHATGTPEEYIDSAIQKGIKVFGFSDHAPLPDNLRDGITMYVHQTEEYIELISKLRNQYKEQIDIKIGFEVDYPLHNTFEKKYLTDERLDYLIGSCHFIEDWPFDHPDFIEKYEKYGVDNVYKTYYQHLAEMVSSGYFNIVGHFDLVKKFGHRSSVDFNDEIVKISKLVCKNNMAVEINTAGLRKPVKEMYPSEQILKILYKENVPVTLGSDSHTPQEVAADFDKAIELIKKIGYRKVSAFSKRKRYEIDI